MWSIWGDHKHDKCMIKYNVECKGGYTCMGVGQPFLWWKHLYSQSATRSQVEQAGNCTITGTQCWFLLMASWAFSSCCSHISHSERKSMLLSPSITFIPVTLGTSFMNPLGNEKVCWRKVLTAIHRMVHFIQLIIEVLLCWVQLLMSIYMTQISLYHSFIWRGLYF